MAHEVEILRFQRYMLTSGRSMIHSPCRWSSLVPANRMGGRQHLSF